MSHQFVSLNEINFSQPDGEFVFQEQTYQVKQYLGKYFFKNKLHSDYNFIFSFKYSRAGEQTCQNNQLSKYFGWFQPIEKCIQRCVQYENTIFCFSSGSREYRNFGIGNGVYFSLNYGVWISFNWEPLDNMSLNGILEQPEKLFLEQAINAYNHAPFKFYSLEAIDFSQPSGEFIFNGQTYVVKEYLGKYVFRNKFCKNYDFIYSFKYEATEIQNDFQKTIYALKYEKLIDISDKIQRCINYENTIFCFDSNCWGEYCSFNSRYWIPFRWKPHAQLTLDDIIEQPNEFFLEQATSVYHPFYIKVYDEELHPSLRTACEFKEQSIEFVRGCESELKRLTQVAAIALSELQPLFEQDSDLKVIYHSFESYYPLGFGGINTVDRYNKYDIKTFSPKAQQLFNLIFDYNFFTGFMLVPTQEEMVYCYGYLSYEEHPYEFVVELQPPSEHERLEAIFELQSWLEGKLPEEEIRSYFEGDYALNPPNPIEKLRQLQLEAEDDIPF